MPILDDADSEELRQKTHSWNTQCHSRLGRSNEEEEEAGEERRLLYHPTLGLIAIKKKKSIYEKNILLIKTKETNNAKEEEAEDLDFPDPLTQETRRKTPIQAAPASKKSQPHKNCQHWSGGNFQNSSGGQSALFDS